MARNENFVSITGNATRDPEMKFLPSGVAVTEFGMAYNPRVRLDDGTYDNGEPMFFDVVTWRGLAENVAASIVTGQRITVTGSLRYEAWTNDEGEKRSKVKITADMVGVDHLFGTTSYTKTAGKGSKTSGSGKSYEPPADDDEAPF